MDMDMKNHNEKQREAQRGYVYGENKKNRKKRTRKITLGTCCALPFPGKKYSPEGYSWAGNNEEECEGDKGEEQREGEAVEVGKERRRI